MKDHFPFTSYDFYAYLASGGLLLAVLDYVFNSAALIGKSDWSFTQIALVVAGAYVVGHLVAMFAQGLLETWFVSKVIAKPMRLQLRMKKANWFERLIGRLVGRYYAPLPQSTCDSIIQATAANLNKEASDITDCEDVFLFGFKKTFEKDAIRTRIDDFRNQYGFCRNISFVALIATTLFCWKAWVDCDPSRLWWALVALFVFFGMFIRYVKFLGSFQSEVVRACK
jgi:hypothetical protein